MGYSKSELRAIYDRTNGKCHLCGSKRALNNHGRTNARGAWHVDHSVPRSRGGTDHGNNLRVACTDCNCSKQDRSTRSIRRAKGLSSAPRSRAAQDKADFWSTIGELALAVGGIIALGAILGGIGAQTPTNQPNSTSPT
ncbi:MAG: HNH endonuclease [Gemmatimonadaceae bacterium]